MKALYAVAGSAFFVAAFCFQSAGDGTPAQAAMLAAVALLVCATVAKH